MEKTDKPVSRCSQTNFSLYNPTVAVATKNAGSESSLRKGLNCKFAKKTELIFHTFRQLCHGHLRNQNYSSVYSRRQDWTQTGQVVPGLSSSTCEAKEWALQPEENEALHLRRGLAAQRRSDSLVEKVRGRTASARSSDGLDAYSHLCERLFYTFLALYVVQTFARKHSHNFCTFDSIP